MASSVPTRIGSPEAYVTQPNSTVLQSTPPPVAPPPPPSSLAQPAATSESAPSTVTRANQRGFLIEPPLLAGPGSLPEPAPEPISYLSLSAEKNAILERSVLLSPSSSRCYVPHPASKGKRGPPTLVYGCRGPSGLSVCLGRADGRPELPRHRQRP